MGNVKSVQFIQQKDKDKIRVVFHKDKKPAKPILHVTKKEEVPSENNNKEGDKEGEESEESPDVNEERRHRTVSFCDPDENQVYHYPPARNDSTKKEKLKKLCQQLSAATMVSPALPMNGIGVMPSATL